MVKPPGTRQLLDESRSDLVIFESTTGRKWIVDVSVNIGVREELTEGLENFLSPSHVDQPVMYDGNLHLNYVQKNLHDHKRTLLQMLLEHSLVMNLSRNSSPDKQTTEIRV